MTQTDTHDIPMLVIDESVIEFLPELDTLTGDIDLRRVQIAEMISTAAAISSIDLIDHTEEVAKLQKQITAYDAARLREFIKNPPSFVANAMHLKQWNIVNGSSESTELYEQRLTLLDDLKKLADLEKAKLAQSKPHHHGKRKATHAERRVIKQERRTLTRDENRPRRLHAATA